jgi:hypothetical protein
MNVVIRHCNFPYRTYLLGCFRSEVQVDIEVIATNSSTIANRTKHSAHSRIENDSRKPKPPAHSLVP